MCASVSERELRDVEVKFCCRRKKVYVTMFSSQDYFSAFPFRDVDSQPELTAIWIRWVNSD